MSVFLATERCAGCGACLRTCPQRALRVALAGDFALPITLTDRCTGCAECAEICPVDAFIEVDDPSEL